jgi:sister chromatid cohesion protein PDS5
VLLLYCIRAAAEHALAEYIFPLVPSSFKEGEIEESIWTDRLLTTMTFLNEKAISSLISFSGLKITQVPSSPVAIHLLRLA